MKIEVGEKYLIRSTGEVVKVEKFLSKDTIQVSGINGKQNVLCNALKEIKIQKSFTN